ncbi:hypothetical protein DN395_11230 [Bacillus sp. AR18-7]|nr:hypothetical protein DN395_11230 [Bacillus sp. AR18-7]
MEYSINWKIHFILYQFLAVRQGSKIIVEKPGFDTRMDSGFLITFGNDDGDPFPMHLYSSDPLCGSVAKFSK